MQKIWAAMVAVLLGLALSACSKCDMPDLLQRSCKGGTGPSQTLADHAAELPRYRLGKKIDTT
jgi:hypothetical protein